MIPMLLSLVAAFVLVLMAGAGVLSLVVPGPLRISDRLALSWLTGSMLVSLSLWICSFCARGLILQGLVSLVCLGLGLVALVRRKQIVRTRLTTGEWVLLVLLLVQFALLFYVSFKRTLGWDGLLNWEFKARIAYENGGAMPPEYFTDQERAFSHPEYPLGIPNLELWSYLWLGEANQFWIKAIFPCFYAAGALLLAGLVERLSQRRIFGFIAALLFFFVPQFLVTPGAAITGYADFPLAIFYLGAIGFLILDDREGGWFWLAAVFLSFLPWIKREGIVLWMSGASCALLFNGGRPMRKTILGLSGGLLIFIGWRSYLLANHFSIVADFGFGAESVRQNLGRVFPTLVALRQNLFELESWSLLWYGAAASLMILFSGRNSHRARLLLLAIAIPLCFDVTVYIFSTWPDYLRHVNLSLNRLILQVAPTAFLLVSFAVATLVSGLTKSDGALESTVVRP